MIARELGLTGWVMNEWDGSVSMELQGSSNLLGLYFTLFDRSYANYPIRYVIEERDDIDPIEGDEEFVVRFS